MKIIVAPHAERDLSRQIEYLVSRNAATAARRLHSRITVFVERMLAKHPRVGTFLTHRDLWETWVPGTRLVVWYRFSSDELQIVRIWHGAQDRENT